MRRNKQQIDEAKIREAIKFHRIPGRVSVRYVSGTACITISKTSQPLDVWDVWYHIGINRASGGNGVMYLRVNGSLYIYCRECKSPKPRKDFGRDKATCLSCLNPSPSTYYKPDPLKVKARLATRKAIKDGSVRSKPANCEACGELDDYLTIHHLDYAKPLEIEWLCTTCHGKRHRGNKRFEVFKSHNEARLAWI